jgi:fused signal recognition particle receptor
MLFKFWKKNKKPTPKELHLPKASFGKKIKTLFKGKINTQVIEQFEAILYEADLGRTTTQELVDDLRLKLENQQVFSFEEVQKELHKKLLARINNSKSELQLVSKGPTVIFVVGVNGSGKTTSIAKLAHYFKKQNLKVLVAAADTFRAAAINQLSLWAERLDLTIVKGMPKSDPSAVVYDALTASIKRDMDICIIDTAGRLQTKTPLMQELQKMHKICERQIPNSPHETLLVLDASIGQNAIDQVISFNKFTPLTGIILSKLDGTAKGGSVIALQEKLPIPVKFIGIGEKSDDFESFNPSRFITSILEA